VLGAHSAKAPGTRSTPRLATAKPDPNAPETAIPRLRG